MAIAFALTVVVLWVAEARFIDPDTNWAQHLGSALLGCIGAAVWAAFGLVIAATTRWRHTGPRVERVVHLAVVVVTCAGSLYLLALSIRVAVTGE